ncbi:hypothetical protein D3C80_2175120 [compost metagenome]
MLGTVAQEQGLVFVAKAAQGADFGPPGHDKTAVASRGAAAAHVLFKHHDAGIRFKLLDCHGGP